MANTDMSMSGSGSMDMSGSGSMDMSGSGSMDMSGSGSMDMSGSGSMDMSGSGSMDMSGSGSMDMSGSGSMDMSGSGCMGMVMSFYWSEQVTIVFQSWYTATSAQYWGSVVAVLVLSFLFQFIFNFRLRFDDFFRERDYDGEKRSARDLWGMIFPGSFRGHDLLRRLVRSIVFTAQILLGYFLMLVVMTYNSMLATAVIVGYGIGYFFFSAEHRRDSFARGQILLAQEDCHS